MNAGVLKILIRFVGSISGVIGLALLYIFLRAFTKGLVNNTPKIVVAIAALLLGAYFLWVCYLVWCRLSPSAVQQVCGLLGYYLLGVFAEFFVKGKEHSQPPWMAFVFLGLLALIFWSYRVLSRCLNRILFPPGRENPD
jgi:hypothetical protein